MRKILAWGLALALMTGTAFAQNTANYNEQGGSRHVIGGSLDVVSGGEIDVESGASLKIGGTAVTSSAAELNILDGVTAASGDLNVLDGLTASTAELNILDGVTAASGDINRLDGLTPGTASASSAVVLGSNKNIDTIVVADGGLYLGSGAGTAVTATAAELNVLDNVGVVKEEITLLADPVASVSFTIGTESLNVINVAGQLKNAQNANVSGVRFIAFWLSDTTTGGITGAVPDSTGSIAASGSIVVTSVAKGAFTLVTDANGAFEFDFGDTGTPTFYPIVALPSGKLSAGSAITFAP